MVQDLMRGWGWKGSQAPDLTWVVREIAERDMAYGCRAVTGGRYAGEWVRRAFREAGLGYREAEWDKSSAYLTVEPLFSQGRIGLLDHPLLVRELKQLERRPRAGGKALVDHPAGAAHHDDYANSLALAAALALRLRRGLQIIDNTLTFEKPTVTLTPAGAPEGPLIEWPPGHPRRRSF